MKYHCTMLLVLLAFLAIACDVNEAAAFPIPWGCSNYSGVCRAVCLSAELPFGPFGCAKGFVCCVAHVF
ncbi:beta-defensin 4 precursor [Oncorhynchus mykiss]|uniref:Defensin beta 4 n=2 Tax=Oncorhynchus TaxID=8016 RepID=C9WX71_ONCMY|nr:beta-defensin 4 precursor [Oncorhynchus mykiss]CAR82092.1 defensin beta 4 [Oncorhynchus mykiss]CBB12549.1 defensin beta 4 [Oncorhynchus mykiss]CDQ68088.1 unnamed protein product [Oncorhynchus mykiss]